MHSTTVSPAGRLDRLRNYLHLLAALLVPPALRHAADSTVLADDAIADAQRTLAACSSSSDAELAGMLRGNLDERIRACIGVAADGDARLEANCSAHVNRAAERIKAWLGIRDLVAAAPPEREQPLERLADALAELVPSDRRAVELKYLTGWGIAAVSKDMGESEIAVAGHLRRALVRLHGRLSETP
jgi:hypothetical protein